MVILAVPGILFHSIILHLSICSSFGDFFASSLFFMRFIQITYAVMETIIRLNSQIKLIKTFGDVTSLMQFIRCSGDFLP